MPVKFPSAKHQRVYVCWSSGIILGIICSRLPLPTMQFSFPENWLSNRTWKRKESEMAVKSGIVTRDTIPVKGIVEKNRNRAGYRNEHSYSKPFCSWLAKIFNPTDSFSISETLKLILEKQSVWNIKLTNVKINFELIIWDFTMFETSAASVSFCNRIPDAKQLRLPESGTI